MSEEHQLHNDGATTCYSKLIKPMETHQTHRNYLNYLNNFNQKSLLISQLLQSRKFCLESTDSSNRCVNTLATPNEEFLVSNSTSWMKIQILIVIASNSLVRLVMRNISFTSSRSDSTKKAFHHELKKYR